MLNRTDRQSVADELVTDYLDQTVNHFLVVSPEVRQAVPEALHHFTKTGQLTRAEAVAALDRALNERLRRETASLLNALPFLSGFPE